MKLEDRRRYAQILDINYKLLEKIAEIKEYIAKSKKPTCDIDLYLNDDVREGLIVTSIDSILISKKLFKDFIDAWEEIINKENKAILKKLQKED